VSLLFTPHLVPMSRGILACVYADPTDAARREADYRAALTAAYADEPFVDVLPAGQLPDTAHVRGSNRCHVQVVHDRRSGKVLAMSAIDNLVKGAAGQAVQCLNLARGWPETLGLGHAPLFP
jgi:N-acetyl-gamma-glutamyl-phosphate reductase